MRRGQLSCQVLPRAEPHNGQRRFRSQERASRLRRFDEDKDGTVTVDEMIIAVNNALDGCPMVTTTS
jgi:Ca2+-binding EF-hand superfamily protein